MFCHCARLLTYLGDSYCQVTDAISACVIYDLHVAIESISARIRVRSKSIDTSVGRPSLQNKAFHVKAIFPCERVAILQLFVVRTTVYTATVRRERSECEYHTHKTGINGTYLLDFSSRIFTFSLLTKDTSQYEILR